MYKNTILSIIALVVAVGTLVRVLTVTAHAATCTVPWRGGAIAQSFVEPYNIFNSDTTLFTVDCQPNSYKTTISDGSANLYFYKDAHITTDGDKFTKKIPVTGVRTDGDWIIGQATANISYFDSQVPTNYLAFYSCPEVDGLWRCGCKSANDCSVPAQGNFIWNLGGFDTQKPGTTTTATVRSGTATGIAADSTNAKESQGLSQRGGVNVKDDCGAKGDGQHNDASAIQACLDKNAVVYFPAGDYFIGDNRNYFTSANRSVHGEGKIIGSHKLGIFGGTGELKDLVVDGLSFYRITTSSSGFGPGSIYLDGVTINNMVIRNCHFDSDQQVAANAILVVGTPDHLVNDLTIENNTMEHITRMGIEILRRPVGGLEPRNNNVIFRNNLMSASPREQSIGISTSNTKGNILIENNTITDFGWGIELSGTHNATARRNVINVSSRGFSVNGTFRDIGEISMYNVIEDNRVTCPDMPLEALGAQHNTITHNDFNGSSKYSVVFQAAQDNHVTWNLLHGKTVKQWKRKGVASDGNVLEHNNDEVGAGPR